jgi:hypothetical protein
LTGIPGIDRILTLTKQIVSGSRTGTAIDAYEVAPLWELGQSILDSGRSEDELWPVVEFHLSAQGISLKPTLLRNAARVRRFWPTKEEFDPVAKVLSYGKLKDVIQIFDPRANVPRATLDGFLLEVGDKTYKETLAAARRIKARYIRPLHGTEIDTDAVTDAVWSATSELSAVVDRNDEAELERLRGVIPACQSRDLRLLLSALQNPAVREKHEAELRRVVLPPPERVAKAGFGALAEAVRTLSSLRNADPASLAEVRTEAGLSFLGELATILRATESTDERNRFIRNRAVLQRFLAQGGS